MDLLYRRWAGHARPSSLPTIFNLMVDAIIICKWDRLLLLEALILGKVRVMVAIFYADDMFIAA